MTDSDRPATDLLDAAYPYALDAVDTAERERIQQSAGRAGLRERLAFDRTVGSVADVLAALTAVDSVPPPSALEARILRALPTAQRLGRPARQPSFRQRRWKLGLAAAAAAIVAAAGVVTVTELTQHPTPLSAERVRDQGDAATRSTPMAGGTLTVTVSDALHAAVVELHGVPAPTPGRTYELWLIPQNGQPRPSGLVDDPQRTGQRLLTDLGDAVAVAVTSEPAGGSPQPSGTPIASVGLT